MYRKAEYSIVNDKLEAEVVHYETSGEQVKIFDEDMNVLGELQELMLNGKKLTGEMADVKRIKYSGIYLVGSDMKNPPMTIAVGKTVILQSVAVGKKGNPDFVHFKFIHPEGHVFDNTVVGSKESGWSSGGQTLKKELSDVKSTLDINTTNITNLSKELDDLKSQSDKTDSELTDHNHDTRYLKLTGGNIRGDLGLQHGGSFQFVSAQGDKKNFASYSVEKGAVIGDKSVVFDILSKGDIKHNGMKVWSEVNHGRGSGLDADKLHGFSGSDYARKSAVNSFTEDQKLSNGKSMIFEDDSSSSGVVWKDKKGVDRAAIKSDQNGKINFSQKDGKVLNLIESDGHIVTKRGMYLDASNVEGHVVFQLDHADKGIGFYRNNGSKYLGIYNWAKGERLGYFHQDEGHLHLDKAPSITGRRLYMQGSQPKGKTVGDIWIS